MKRIRLSRILEKKDAATGAVRYSRAVNVDQWPAQSVTVWLRSNDPNKYLLNEYEAGTYTADMYLVDNEYTNKAGVKVSEHLPRFRDLELVVLATPAA